MNRDVLIEVDDRMIGNAIISELKVLASETYKRMVQKAPELSVQTSKTFIEKSIRDIEYTILYLSNAISVSSTQIFVNYVQWFMDIMKSLSIPTKYLKISIEAIQEILSEYFPSYEEIIIDYIEAGLKQIGVQNVEEPSPVRSIHILKPYRDKYIKFLLNGDRFHANALVQDLIAHHYSIQDIYMEIFSESQREIGRLWQTNEISIAEEHYCTASTQLIMGQLYPYIFSTPKNDLVFVGTCVGGELHELGVRMVSDFLELDGWNTYYLGANTPSESVIDMIVEKSAHVLGISVTMAYHLEEARLLIDKVRSTETCKNTKIIVGGYPFLLEDQLWKTMGADGTAGTARDAVELINHLVKEVPHE